MHSAPKKERQHTQARTTHRHQTDTKTNTTQNAQARVKRNDVQLVDAVGAVDARQ